VKLAVNLRAIAQEMKAAQDEVRQIAPLTSQLTGFDDAVSYDVAHLIHQARINEGAVPVGRKIGFTNKRRKS
jgi:2-keto-4-pentenoate hydratase